MGMGFILKQLCQFFSTLHYIQYILLKQKNITIIHQMLQSAILQKFIRNRLKDKLYLFFQLEHSIIEGLTIRNLGIKPDLLRQLSQIIKVPLILTSGMIGSVSLNIPWESLFSTKKDQAISVVISDIKIAAKLPNDLQKQYIMLNKKRIIQKFTQQFSQKATSRLAIFNKLKQYFFGTFCIEVKNIDLQVNIQMKHSLTAQLKINYMKFQKDIKTNKAKFQINHASLGYRLAKQTKTQYIINKADLLFTGEKTSEIDMDHLETNNLFISFTNDNFNDVRRIITLIKWHNSFVDIPRQLWAVKPSIIGEISPKKKLIYVANIIKYRIMENKKKLNKILEKRRQYLKVFENVRRDPNDTVSKNQLNSLDQQLQIWRVKEYRKFCLLWSKKFPNQPHSRTGKKQTVEKKGGWLNYWFPKSAQIQIKQLEACLDSTPVCITKKHFSFSIQQIKISLFIRSLAGKQPFINLISYNNQIETTKIPLSDQKKMLESQIEYVKDTKIFVHKMVVQYDKYAGHHQDHLYLMNQLANQIKNKTETDEMGMNDQEDEFEDIQNFLQCSITPNQTNIRVQPIVIRLNEDTLQKLSVYKLERIHNTFQNAEKIILQQNTFEQDTNKKQTKQLNVKTSVYVRIPQNMCEKQTQQINLGLQNIQYMSGQAGDRLTVESVVLSAVLNMTNQQQLSSNHSSMNKVHEESTVPHYQNIELMRTKLEMKKQLQGSVEKSEWVIYPIKITFSSIYHLQKLIRLLSKLKPKKKDRKPLYKLKNLRRKQSIGQQFIDACENLNEHLMRSATLSQKTRYEKYIIKQKKDKITQVRLEGLKASIETSEIELTQSTISLFQFSQYKSLTVDSEQKVVSIRLYNIKNTIKNIKQIKKQLERMFQLSGNKQILAVEKNQSELQGDTIAINNLNIYLEIYYQKDLKISAEITNIFFQVQRDRNIKMELTVGLAYFQYPDIKNKQKNNRIKKKEQESPIKQFVVQPCKIVHFHQKKYNKDQKTIKISTLNFNIKPNLFVELGMLFDQLNTPQHLRIQIINATANTVNLSTTGNIYKEYKPHHVAISSNINCDIIMFGRKEVLTLSAEAGTQQIKLTQRLSLIKALRTEYIYQIQSNVRITNRQEHTIWVRVITNQGMTKMRKDSIIGNGLVTFEHLSHVQMDRSVEDEDNFKNSANNNFKRSSSLNQRLVNKSEESQKEDEENEIDKMDIQIKKVKITHSVKQQTQKYKDDHIKQSTKKSQKSEQNLQEPVLKKQSNKSMAQKRKQTSNYEILFQPIAPEHTIQILLNSEDYYIEIVEYDTKGQVHQKYQPFKIKQILSNNNQLLTHSYIFDSWGNKEDSGEISSSLVVATNVTKHSQENPISLYNIQILSPIVMVNKIPSPLQFRLNKQEVDMLEVINSAGRSIRKRSFQVVELENIESFNICRINKMMYKEISETEIRVAEYTKNFRLDHIIEKLKQNEQEIDIRIIDLLCLNNGAHQIQMGIQIRILKHIMKITIFPQFIFINMTQIPIKLQIKQQNYSYPQIQLNPLTAPKDSKNKTHYKQYIKISNQKLGNPKALQQLFKEFTNNINIFTGSFDQDMVRSIRYGNKQSFVFSNMYNTYELTQNQTKTRQKQILYDNNIKLILRKIRIDDKPINMVLFMPSLYIINKSDWSFFIKGEGDKEKLKKIQKNSTEYMLINDTIAIQACEEYEQIAYNEWLKIMLTTLGTIYYAKQMTASNGYQSRQYELRKKRLKKVPKLFFRIVMAKYQYGYQILIEESQYPPVTFISRCKSRIQIKQTTENIIEQMEQNQMAEYASKISHHVPKFSLSVVEHYQFKNYGEFYLNQPQKILSRKIKLTIEQYKDKQIVIFEDYQKVVFKNKNQSVIRNELLLQKLERLVVNISNIQFSILTKFNKELSCACLRGLEIQHETKNTKKYIKVNMDNLEIFSYNGLQPKYLFYSKSSNYNSIGRKQVLGLFKRKGQSQLPNLQASQMYGNMYLNKSLMASAANQQLLSSNPLPASQQILSLDIVIDYHKHATILQKCKVTISQLVIVINANTLIDYLKYYYKQMCQLSDLLRKHQQGRKILTQITNIFTKKNNDPHDPHTDIQQNKPTLARKNSVSINNIGNTLMKKNTKTTQSSKASMRHHHHEHHQQVPPPDSEVGIMHRGFIIQNFVWDGLKVAIKFQNLDNLQYFMSNKEIKYLIKFITWVGDLRPIQFSPTQVEYQKYTILKLIQLIDLNKLIRQLTQTFLQYPLQQLYHIISFITRFVGLNQQQQNNQQWHTFKRLGKSILNISKKIFSSNTNNATYIVNQNGELVENKFYLEQFMEDNANNHNILSKIMGFKYQEWRYNQETRQNRLNIKALRLQRYSPTLTLLPYQSSKSRIQTAINDYCGNKIFREIKHIAHINRETIIGLTQDWFVLYSIEKQQWIVARPQDVLQLCIQKNKSKPKSVFNMGSEKQLVATLMMQKQKNKESGKIQRFVFGDLTITKTDIEAIEQKLADMRLSSVY